MLSAGLKFVFYLENLREIQLVKLLLNRTVFWLLRLQNACIFYKSS